MADNHNDKSLVDTNERKEIVAQLLCQRYTTQNIVKHFHEVLDIQIDKRTIEKYIQQARIYLMQVHIRAMKEHLSPFILRYESYMNALARKGDYRGAARVNQMLCEMLFGKPTLVVDDKATANQPLITVVVDGKTIDMKLSKPKDEDNIIPDAEVIE